MILRALAWRSAIHFSSAARELSSQSLAGPVDGMSAGDVFASVRFATSGTNALRKPQAKTLLVMSSPTW